MPISNFILPLFAVCNIVVQSRKSDEILQLNLHFCLLSGALDEMIDKDRQDLVRTLSMCVSLLREAFIRN